MSFYRVFIRLRSNACSFQREVFHCRLASPSYSKQLEKTHKCQATVKLPGSFCPRTTRPRLHSHLNFAVYVFKTVVQSFYHSCGSELTRQGTSLMMLFLRWYTSNSPIRIGVRTISSSPFLFNGEVQRVVSEGSRFKNCI